MFKELIKNKSRGVTLVEIVVAIAVLGIIFATLGGTIIFGIRNSKFSGERDRATFIASEGIEAVRNIRDNDFANLIDGSYGLSIVGNEWVLTGSQDVIDEFTRTVDISSVNANIKEISSTVSWDQATARPGSVSVITRLANWMQEIIEIGDWSNPAEEASLNISGNGNGMKIQAQGNYVYMVRSYGNPDFLIIDVSNPATPIITGSLGLSGGPRNIAVNGNYAYIGNNSNTQELQIIDISVPSAPSVAGTLNLSGNANANGIFYSNSKAFVVRSSSGSNELSIVDVTNPVSPSEIGSVNLSSTTYEVYVSGNYVYIASAHNSRELQVVDATSPALPSVIATYNLSGNSNALSITGFDDIVLLGRNNGDVAVLDISSPSSPILLGTYNDHHDDIRDVSLGNSNNYAFLASDANSAEFQVIDISTLASPVLVGSYNISGDLNGIVYHENLDRVFAVGENNSKEMIVIAPQ